MVKGAHRSFSSPSERVQMHKHPVLHKAGRAVWAQNSMTQKFWLLVWGREHVTGRGLPGCPRTNIYNGSVGQLLWPRHISVSCCTSSPGLQLRVWGSAFLSLEKVAPPTPDLHKSCMKATTSSLHHMEAGYSSSLCTRTATAAKNSPPAVGQLLLHPNPMETSKSGRQRP